MRSRNACVCSGLPAGALSTTVLKRLYTERSWAESKVNLAVRNKVAAFADSSHNWSVASLWQQVADGEGFDLSAELPRIREEFGFVSGSSRHADRLATIRSVHETDGEWLDPHTADGVKVARKLREDGETVVCLETALAAKFADTVSEAAGRQVDVPRPAVLAGLESLPQYVSVLPNSAAAVKELIERALA